MKALALLAALVVQALAAVQLQDDSGLAALHVLDEGGLAGQGEDVGHKESVREGDPLYLSYFRQLTSGDRTQLGKESYATPKVMESGHNEASEDQVSQDIESTFYKALETQESGLTNTTQAVESGFPEARESGPSQAFLVTDSELLHISQARELGLPEPIQFEEPWLLESIPGQRVRTPRGQPRPIKAKDTRLGKGVQTFRGNPGPESQDREPVLPEAIQAKGSKPSEVQQDQRARTVRRRKSRRLTELDSQAFQKMEQSRKSKFQDPIPGQIGRTSRGKPDQRDRNSKHLSSQENQEFQKQTQLELKNPTKGQRVRAFRVLQKPNNQNFKNTTNERESRTYVTISSHDLSNIIGNTAIRWKPSTGHPVRRSRIFRGHSKTGSQDLQQSNQVKEPRNLKATPSNRVRTSRGHKNLGNQGQHISRERPLQVKRERISSGNSGRIARTWRRQPRLESQARESKLPKNTTIQRARTTRGLTCTELDCETGLI